jgi:hydrogenase maturation protease
MSAHILIAGVGNIFLGDDGFGVAVAQKLADRPLPDGVAVADIGVRTLHLAFALLDKPDLLVVVDIVDRGVPPGTLSLIEPQIAGGPTGLADAHGMNLETVNAAVASLGGEMPTTLVVGCQPEFIGERLGLSAVVEQAIPDALVLIEKTIARFMDSRPGAAAAANAAEETA